MVIDRRIAAVLVDLDDTLFPQSTWLRGAWHAVAAAAPDLDARAFEDALVAVASEGSDRGRIINRALDRVGVGTAERVDVNQLVAAFRAHQPASLECYDGARRALRVLRSHVPVALVSDGDPLIQRAKIDSLGLGDAFDAIVLSDELGREFRKPNPAPFVIAGERLEVSTRDCVMIGDRPDKDVAGARAAGLLGTVRVLTGEYAATPTYDALAEVADFVEAVSWLRPELDLERRDSAATPQTNRRAQRQRKQAERRPSTPGVPTAR